jgi:ADP-heptose:LPS heptosyltransferase
MITVVSGLHEVDVMRILPRSHFLHFHEHEINAFFLPRRELLRRATSRRPDVAIDLNLDFVLPSAYICRVSGARIRVGFARKHADIFYNFQIRPDPTLARKLIYDRLAGCLDRF